MADNVNHPSHYAEGWSNGAEVIDITENLNFNRGNAVKYIARAGKKGVDTELEDLEKAQWYLGRELERLNRMLKPGSRWTLEEVSKLREQMWDSRFRREWRLIDHVPPGVIVEDVDGDYYRRIQGTSRFVTSYREDTHGQHYEWQDIPLPVYRILPDFGPFKEVISG